MSCMDGYDEDDMDDLPSVSHVDRPRDSIESAIDKLLAGDATALDDYELECIHEPFRWHPRHVRALIRGLKRARAEIEDVRDGLHYNEELLEEVDAALVAGSHTADLARRVSERHKSRTGDEEGP